MAKSKFNWAKPNFDTLKKISDRWWFFPFQGLLAGLDHWIAVVPTDGLLIGSVFLKPRQWIWGAICFAVGSTLGGATVVYAVHHWGTALVDNLQPTLRTSESWIWAETFLKNHGNWAVFLVGAGPLPLFPPLALVTLAGLDPATTIALTLIGRQTKYLILGSVAAYSPKLLDRLIGIQKDKETVFGKKD